MRSRLLTEYASAVSTVDRATSWIGEGFAKLDARSERFKEGRRCRWLKPGSADSAGGHQQAWKLCNLSVDVPSNGVSYSSYASRGADGLPFEGPASTSSGSCTSTAVEEAAATAALFRGSATGSLTIASEKPVHSSSSSPTTSGAKGTSSSLSSSASAFTASSLTCCERS